MTFPTFPTFPYETGGPNAAGSGNMGIVSELIWGGEFPTRSPINHERN